MDLPESSDESVYHGSFGLELRSGDPAQMPRRMHALGPACSDNSSTQGVANTRLWDEVDMTLCFGCR